MSPVISMKLNIGPNGIISLKWSHFASVTGYDKVSLSDY